jgi:hypothetical protein
MGKKTKMQEWNHVGNTNRLYGVISTVREVIGGVHHFETITKFVIQGKYYHDLDACFEVDYTDWFEKIGDYEVGLTLTCEGEIIFKQKVPLLCVNLVSEFFAGTITSQNLAKFFKRPLMPRATKREHALIRLLEAHYGNIEKEVNNEIR